MKRNIYYLIFSHFLIGSSLVAQLPFPMLGSRAPVGVAMNLGYGTTHTVIQDSTSSGYNHWDFSYFPMDSRGYVEVIDPAYFDYLPWYNVTATHPTYALYYSMGWRRAYTYTDKIILGEEGFYTEPKTIICRLNGGPACSTSYTYTDNLQQVVAGTNYMQYSAIGSITTPYGTVDSVAMMRVTGDEVLYYWYTINPIFPVMELWSNNRAYFYDAGHYQCHPYFEIHVTSTPGLYIGYNLSTGNSLSYHWDFGDGGTSNVAYPSHTYAQPGNYNICLTVDNGSGCSTTYCDSSYLVFKTDSGLMNQLNIYPPATGINELTDQNELRVFPNPVTEFFSLSVPERADYILFDAVGREVRRGIVDSQSQIFVSELTAGIYFVSVKNADGLSKTVRFLKE